MDCYKLRDISIVVLILVCCSIAHAQSGVSNVASINNLKNAAYCSDTSVSANTITCSTAVGFTGYVAGQSVDVLLANTITNATTININTLGAKAVTYNGTNALTSVLGLVASSTMRLTYDGTRFIIEGLVTAGTTPGSPTLSIQYNNAGSFAGSSKFTVDTTNGIMHVSDIYNIPPSGSAVGFNIFNRGPGASVTFAVPTFQPDTNGNIGVFDMFPKGSAAQLAASDAAGNARVAADWCNTDLVLAEVSGFNCLHFDMYNTGIADIGFAQSGSFASARNDLNIKASGILRTYAGNSLVTYTFSNPGVSPDQHTFIMPDDSNHGAMSLQSYVATYRALMLSNQYPLAWGTDTSVNVNSLFNLDSGIGRTSAGVLEINNGTLGTLRDLKGRNATWSAYLTATNCSNAASPAVCGSAAAGAVAIPTGVTSVTLQVNTTAVTANSRINLMSDDSLTIAATTCNSTLATLVGGLAVTARNPGVSFTITYNGTIATNPLCVSYTIEN